MSVNLSCLIVYTICIWDYLWVRDLRVSNRSFWNLETAAHIVVESSVQRWWLVRLCKNVWTHCSTCPLSIRIDNDSASAPSEQICQIQGQWNPAGFIVRFSHLWKYSQRKILLASTIIGISCSLRECHTIFSWRHWLSESSHHHRQKHDVLPAKWSML